jgi:hypothetical protein
VTGRSRQQHRSRALNQDPARGEPRPARRLPALGRNAKDSEALIQHAANVGDLMQAVLATGSVSGELLGEPSAGLRAQPAGGPVSTYHEGEEGELKSLPAL